MESNSFKPSIKIPLLEILIIGALFVAALFMIPTPTSLDEDLFGTVNGIVYLILFYFLYHIVTSLIEFLFTTYTITSKNEIRRDYSFITKSSALYRSDQVTKVTWSQSIIERLFRLGTIRFSIFGESIDGTSRQTIKESGLAIKKQAFFNIKKSRDKFKDLNDSVGISMQKPLYTDKPSILPALALSFVSFILIFVPLLLKLSYTSNWILIFFNVLSIFFGICFLIFFFGCLKDKSTSYTITSEYVKYEYNYILGSYIELVPLQEITNSSTSKDIFSHTLFGVGKVTLFTGSLVDTYLSNLENFEAFNAKLRNILKKKTLEHTGEHPQFKAKPGVAFFIDRAHLTVFLGSIITLVIIPLYILYVIYRLLLWKNTEYEFYGDRIKVKTGVFIISKDEVEYQNIKHINLHRAFFFDKFFHQGTIYVYTAGSKDVEIIISGLKDYEELYNDLKEAIKD